MSQADIINQSFDTAQPWILAKGISQASAEQKETLTRHLLARLGWL